MFSLLYSILGCARICFIPGNKAVVSYLQGKDKKRAEDLPGSSAFSQNNLGALPTPAPLY